MGIIPKIRTAVKQRQRRFAHMEKHTQNIQTYQSGKGKFVYRNTGKNSLELPKACDDGRKSIPAGGEFTGDNYFDMLVKTGFASVVREIKEEAIMEKLLLDQPDTVKVQGTVEHVVVEQKPAKVVQETENAHGDVLLTENPMSGLEILG